MCTTSESKNRQLILTYLIPTKMITKHQLPSRGLLEAHPALATLFSPICSAVRTGNLKALDDALANGETEFVKRRVYLTLERSRDVTIRNLFRKVFLVGGYMPLKEGETTPVRRTRIPIPEFATALVVSGAEVGDGEGGTDRDEVECAIANMIYKVRAHAMMMVSGCILTYVLGLDERLHRARPQHGRPQQGRGFPRHWCLRSCRHITSFQGNFVLPTGSTTSSPPVRTLMRRFRLHSTISTSPHDREAASLHFSTVNKDNLYTCLGR